MLDIRLIREEPEKTIKLLNRRGGDFSYLYEVLAKTRSVARQSWKLRPSKPKRMKFPV